MNEGLKFLKEENLITREIGIDMAHRVPHHASKCKNIHGHRYTVRAMCKGPLFESGEQQGMVLDFGFLKEEMMKIIDDYCDHGTTLWIDDPILRMAISSEDFESTIVSIRNHGYCLLHEISEFFGKLYVVPFVPTAENLAKHWFDRLAPRVKHRTEGKASLSVVKCWETPNCSATYFGGEK